MKKNNIKLYLDYIPYIILCVSTFTLIWTISTTNILLVRRHYLGLILLPIVAILFYKKHLFGVLSLGLTLVVGLIGFISYSPSITTFSFGFGNASDWSVDIIKFQPIFLLWLIIHFLLSGRYYVGILSKKYWLNFRDAKHDKI